MLADQSMTKAKHDQSMAEWYICYEPAICLLYACYILAICLLYACYGVLDAVNCLSMSKKSNLIGVAPGSFHDGKRNFSQDE